MPTTTESTVAANARRAVAGSRSTMISASMRGQPARWCERLPAAGWLRMGECGGRVWAPANEEKNGSTSTCASAHRLTAKGLLQVDLAQRREELGGGGQRRA